MKTKTVKRLKSREGGALVMVMLVLLIFSTLQIGLYKLRQTSSVESVYVEQHKQAFWLAESGLNDGSFLIDYSPAFRNNPTAIPTTTNAMGNGTYDISVVKSTINAAKSLYQYEIISVGTANGFNRRLRKIVRSEEGGKYAIIGISGTTELGPLVKINGDIAQIDGDVSVHDSRYLDGSVIIGNGSLDDKKGEADLRNFPPPPAPTINSSYYDAELAYVNTLTNTPNKTITTSIAAGDTVYMNTDLLTFNGKLSIGDGATIVTSGDIRIEGSGTKIGNNVTIISGDDISFKVQTTVGSGSDIYAFSDITFESGSSLDTNDEAILLMAKTGDIEMNANFDFRGIMIAETGSVELNSNGDITGTIIGGIGIDAAANLTITYDPTVFSATTPIIPNSFGDVILTSISWEELPPL